MADAAAATAQQTATGTQTGGTAAATGSTIATGGQPQGGQQATGANQQTGTQQTTTAGNGQAQGQQGTGTQVAEITAKDLTLPQGFEAAAAEQVAGLAKAMGWSKEQAQKYLDHAAAQAPAAAQAREQAQAQQAQAWLDTVQADKDFGGANFEATKVNAKRGIDALVKSGHLSQDDIAFLNSTGYGNHPILVKIAASLGKALGEDGFGGRTAGGGQGKKSDGDLFYG